MKFIRTHLARLPQRWVVTIMGMLGVTVAYTMRGCMSITITQMVKSMDVNPDRDQEGVCPMTPVFEIPGNDTRMLRVVEECVESFSWDEEIQGMILSSFYYGYIISHIPGGLLAQRFGGKFPMACAMLSSATLTLLTPIVARMGSTHLMVLRFVEGIGEGLTFPALCSLLARWIPPHEKGKLSTLVFAGVPIGNICANLFSGFIMYYVPGGWSYVFYCFGTTALVWLILWLLIIYDDPISHPYISADECKYLHETIGYIERKRNSIPWLSILSSPSVWALVVAEIGFDWGAYTIVNDLPKYMSDVLHFSVKQNSFLSSTPYVAQWIMSIMSSVLSDYMIKNGLLTVTRARKIYAIIGTVGPGLGVMCASLVGCNKFAATLCFTLGMALVGFCYPSIRINALDLSPNYSASIMALVNGLGCLSGMASPYVAGLLTPNRNIFEWRLVFWIMLIILLTTCLIFTIFGSGEIQSWDNGETISSDKKNPEKMKQKIDVKTEDTKFLKNTKMHV